MQSRFWCGRLSVGTKPVLVQQVKGRHQSWFWSRHKAGFGAVVLGSAQSRFWSRHKARFGAVSLGSAQSRFWSRHKARCGAVGLGSAQSRFWSRHKARFGAVGLWSAQSRFWSRHKAGLGAGGYKTGLVEFRIFYRSYKTGICLKTGQYKTCIVSTTKIDCVYINIYIFFCIYIKNMYKE